MTIVLPISPVLLHLGPTFKCLYVCFRCLGTFWQSQNLRPGAAILDFKMAAICFTLLCTSFPVALWKENKDSLYLEKWLLCGNCHHMAVISKFKMAATQRETDVAYIGFCISPFSISFWCGWQPYSISR